MAKRKLSPKKSHWLRNTLLFLVLFIAVGTAGFAYLCYTYVESQLPDVSTLKDAQLPVPMQIFTSDGKLIAEFGELRSAPLTYDQIPKDLINAILATEDQHFFEHQGVDFSGLARAAVELALTGKKSQGGSTITMQLARNFYLTRKKTFMRKFYEILLAEKIDRELSKQRIMELYLNMVFLGNRAYGVAAASQVYYGQSLNQLTLPELAMIAGLPQSPSAVNPISNPIAAKKRRDHVLDRMRDLKFIDQKTYQAAIAAPVSAYYHGLKAEVYAPYVAEMVRGVMVSQYGDDAYSKGFRVYTTIDSKNQLAANQALRQALVAYDHRHGFRGIDKNLGSPNESSFMAWREALQAIPSVGTIQAAAVIDVKPTYATALLANGDIISVPWDRMLWARKSRSDKITDVVQPGDVIRVAPLAAGGWEFAQVPQVEGALISLNPNNGAITSLVGGFGYSNGSFNRVTQAERQPGSNFKPFIYAAALARGFTLASIFNDSPIVINDPSMKTPWRPQNDKNEHFGPTRMRVALVHSRNLVSIRVLAATGLSYAMNYISHFGFDLHKMPYGLSLALGTADVSPLEIATGYCAFANGGYKITPYLIDHINNENGQVMYQAHPPIATDTPVDPANANKLAPRIMSPQVAYMMTSAMRDVIRYGTGRGALILGRNDLAGKTGTTNDKFDAWFSGFNSDMVTTVWVGFDQPKPLGEYGAQAALPMWNSFMEKALQNRPEHTMVQPPGLVAMLIDPKTGWKAAPNQPNAVIEYFVENKVPQAQASASMVANEDDKPQVDEATPDDDQPIEDADVQVATNAGDSSAAPPQPPNNSGDDQAEHLF